MEKLLHSMGWTVQPKYTFDVHSGQSRQAPSNMLLDTFGHFGDIVSTVTFTAPLHTSSVANALSAIASPARAQADQAVRDYAAWYAQYVSRYEQDLHAVNLEDSEGLKYVAEIGQPRLTFGWPRRLLAVNSRQAEQVALVLGGFRGLADLATDLNGRAEWIIEAVEAAEEQMRQLGLILPDIFPTATFVATYPAMHTDLTSSWPQVRMQTEFFAEASEESTNAAALAA